MNKYDRCKYVDAGQLQNLINMYEWGNVDARNRRAEAETTPIVDSRGESGPKKRERGKISDDWKRAKGTNGRYRLYDDKKKLCKKYIEQLEIYNSFGTFVFPLLSCVRVYMDCMLRYDWIYALFVQRIAFLLNAAVHI